jgi:hypothetical protein
MRLVVLVALRRRLLSGLGEFWEAPLRGVPAVGGGIEVDLPADLDARLRVLVDAPGARQAREQPAESRRHERRTFRPKLLVRSDP